MKSLLKKLPAKFKDIRIITVLALIFLCFTVLVINSCSNKSHDTGGSDLKVLARVEVTDYVQDLELPVYATMEDIDEEFYALVIATVSELQAAGVTYKIIDSYSPGVRYILGSSDNKDHHEKAVKTVKVLYDDGRSVIVRYKQSSVRSLAGIGFMLKIMRDTPIDLSPIEFTPYEADAADRSTRFAKSTEIENLIKNITKEDIESFIADISGEKQITVSGELYTLTTRDTESGEPVEKATQYIYEQLNGVGRLTASFQNWEKTLDDEETGEPATYKCRNVIVELPGVAKPDEIIVLIAHLDSIHDDGTDQSAPGADDNGSGCAALFTIAKAMKDTEFKRTIRFVFTTGEEQGIIGGEKYVQSLLPEIQDGKKIVGAINLDMIAFHTKPENIHRIKTRDAKDKNQAADLNIANLYNKVVETYNLNGDIKPVLSPDNELNSDHSPFWENKCAAIWLIEDDYNNFNEENMHSEKDKLSTLNLDYCTAIIQATLGTAAHMADH